MGKSLVSCFFDSQYIVFQNNRIRLPLLLSNRSISPYGRATAAKFAGTDILTDAVPFYRSCFVYYADSANSLLNIRCLTVGVLA